MFDKTFTIEKRLSLPNSVFIAKNLEMEIKTGPNSKYK
jgi:hypothetical protein